MNNQAVFLAATKIKTNRKLKELADKHTQIEERKRGRERERERERETERERERGVTKKQTHK